MLPLSIGAASCRLQGSPKVLLLRLRLRLFLLPARLALPLPLALLQDLLLGGSQLGVALQLRLVVAVAGKRHQVVEAAVQLLQDICRGLGRGLGMS